VNRSADELTQWECSTMENTVSFSAHSAQHVLCLECAVNSWTALLCS
jgi:hypothetical protein